ncbi:MAG: AraC family transcriptional regulator [Verrucomicrobiota bacterium]
MDTLEQAGVCPLYRWSSLRTELLWIYEGEIAAGSFRELTDHRVGYWMWLMKQGRVSLEMDGKVWEAGPGEWILSPQGSVTQDFTHDAKLLSVHFRCQWPTGENLFSGQDGVVWSARENTRLERSATKLNSLIHRHFPKVKIDLTEHHASYPVFQRFEQAFRSWLIEFHDAMQDKGRMLAHAGTGDDRLYRAAQILHESPFNESFPAERLQRDTGLGRAHLDRLYYRQFGVTTREYWERLRQEMALRKLESSSHSVKEIGYELGFKQASHFTKWFTHRVGKNPTAFREENYSLRA